MSVPDPLEEALGPLAAMAGVEGAAVVARDGVLLAGHLPQGVDRSTFGAMSATLMGAACTAAYEFRRRPPDSLLVDMDAWRLLATEAGEAHFVVAVARDGVDPGLALTRLKVTARRVRELLEG